MKKAIYAFSGDPITFGHIDIIERATRVFDEVIVGIGANPSKTCMFALEERAEMARRSLSSLANVRVICFEGLLVDYAYEHEIPVIIKGVRNSSDFDYELQLHNLGGSQKLNIDTYLLPARQDLSHVSSSGVKALQQEQGLIHEYVPLFVKMCLEARISGQHILGVTGEIGAGKSFVSEKLVEAGKKRNVQVHHIELDHIGHKIISDLKEPSYENVRKKILERFGNKVAMEDGSINRKVLGEIVFKNPGKLDELNSILYTPLLVRLRRELYSRKGIIIFNAALILESEMSHLCNNNIVLVSADKKSQKRRLEERKLDFAQIKKRLESQFDCDEKKARIISEIKRTGQGRLWEYDNSDSSDINNIENIENIEALFESVLGELDIFGSARFAAFWNKLGARESWNPEFERIRKSYSSKDRAYHNISHILRGLDELREAREILEDPLCMECAWWYHDIIYDPQCATNEDKSAQDMRDHLSAFGVRKELIDNACELIMTTKHKEIPSTSDGQIISDVDLSILGADEDDFSDYEKRIRREYSMIPDKEFYAGRLKLLEELFGRKTIFNTRIFMDKYEKKARRNIERSMERIKRDLE